MPTRCCDGPPALDIRLAPPSGSLQASLLATYVGCHPELICHDTVSEGQRPYGWRVRLSNSRLPDALTRTRWACDANAAQGEEWNVLLVVAISPPLRRKVKGGKWYLPNARVSPVFLWGLAIGRHHKVKDSWWSNAFHFSPSTGMQCLCGGK